MALRRKPKRARSLFCSLVLIIGAGISFPSFRSPRTPANTWKTSDPHPDMKRQYSLSFYYLLFAIGPPNVLRWSTWLNIAGLHPILKLYILDVTEARAVYDDNYIEIYDMFVSALNMGYPRARLFLLERNHLLSLPIVPDDVIVSSDELRGIHRQEAPLPWKKKAHGSSR